MSARPGRLSKGPSPLADPQRGSRPNRPAGTGTSAAHRGGKTHRPRAPASAPPYLSPRGSGEGTPQHRETATGRGLAAGQPEAGGKRGWRRLFTSGFGGGAAPTPPEEPRHPPRAASGREAAPRRRHQSRGAAGTAPRPRRPPPRTCAGARGRLAVHRGSSHVRPGPGGRPPLPPQRPPVSAGGARPPPAGPGRGAAGRAAAAAGHGTGGV